MPRTPILIAGMLILILIALAGCRPEPGVQKPAKTDGKQQVADQQPADQPEEWIAFVSTVREAKNKIVLLEIHSEQEITVADTPQQQYTDPRFSLDGKKLRYTEYRHHEGMQTAFYWVYDIASGEQTESMEEPPKDEFQPTLSDKSMRLSPDGKWRLSSAKQPEQRYFSVHGLNTESREFKPLLKGRGAKCTPGTYSWNKDSRRYLYIRLAPDNLWQVYIGDIIDGNHKQITSDKENKAMPRWRPTP